ncbi:hypothetical protein ONZ45_g3610 [Pleurotus djamor]|nr:hypothetical protein ONZ45_g3610 [Pleurotus djamor]
MDSMETFKEQAEDVETQQAEEIQGGQPRTSINNLTPPLGTDFFRRQTITFFNGTQIGTSPKVGELVWKADVYTYAVGAKPSDPDFARNGQINVICVHYGFARFYDDFDPDVWTKLSFTLKPKTSGLQPTLQLPSTGSGTKDGDNYKYEIKFGQKMPMFNNGGNQSFTFDAAYEENFARIKATQYGNVSDYIGFGVESTAKSSDHRTVQIHGMSKWTHSNPSAFPVSLERSFTIKMPSQGYSWSIWGNVSMSLGF